jgi:hypothetical protein
MIGKVAHCIQCGEWRAVFDGFGRCARCGRDEVAKRAKHHWREAWRVARKIAQLDTRYSMGTLVDAATDCVRQRNRWDTAEGWSTVLRSVPVPDHVRTDCGVNRWFWTRGPKGVLP